MTADIYRSPTAPEVSPPEFSSTSCSEHSGKWSLLGNLILDFVGIVCGVVPHIFRHIGNLASHFSA